MLVIVNTAEEGIFAWLRPQSIKHVRSDPLHGEDCIIDPYIILVLSKGSSKTNRHHYFWHWYQNIRLQGLYNPTFMFGIVLMRFIFGTGG